MTERVGFQLKEHITPQIRTLQPPIHHQSEPAWCPILNSDLGPSAAVAKAHFVWQYRILFC